MAEQSTEYKCDLCGATFKQADALTKHMAIHDTAKAEKKDLEQEPRSPHRTRPCLVNRPIRARPDALKLTGPTLAERTSKALPPFLWLELSSVATASSCTNNLRGWLRISK